VRTEANGRAGRGRPADPGIERRVLAAALTVYGEVGWAGFTLDRVARRAPVGKAALYRRWPTKEDLLLAALEHLAEPPGDEADPTDLRGCLIGMTEQVIDMFVGPKALVLPRVLIEASQYPPRFDDMVQNIVRARFGTVRTVIQAAADRGELPARTPPDLIIDAIMGRVISLIVLTPGARRATINAERDRYAASITDFVLRAIAGLARDPVIPARSGGGLAEVHQLPQRRCGDGLGDRVAADALDGDLAGEAHVRTRRSGPGRAWGP
jgi:AcrR family transcriptional regulator